MADVKFDPKALHNYPLYVIGKTDRPDESPPHKFIATIDSKREGRIVPVFTTAAKCSAFVRAMFGSGEIGRITIDRMSRFHAVLCDLRNNGAQYVAIDLPAKQGRNRAIVRDIEDAIAEVYPSDDGLPPLPHDTSSRPN